MSLASIWRKRRAIFNALRIDHREPSAAYAIQPFTVIEGDEGNWVAGAVGQPTSGRYGEWIPGDADVILWNPRTGDIRMRRDFGPTLISPFQPEARLTVYADGFAFFRAWADRRAEVFTRLAIAMETHRTTHAEPADGGLPGALAIGDLKPLDWCGTGAAVLVAGPGIDPKALNRAVIRSARLPRVESLAA